MLWESSRTSPILMKMVSAIASVPPTLNDKVLNYSACTNLVTPLSSRRLKGKPAKRPRMNADNAGISAKAGLSRRVRGRLSELPTVPLDILFEVCDMRCRMVSTSPDEHGHCTGL